MIAESQRKRSPAGKTPPQGLPMLNTGFGHQYRFQYQILRSIFQGGDLSCPTHHH